MFTGLANKSEHNLSSFVAWRRRFQRMKETPGNRPCWWEDRLRDDTMLDHNNDGRRNMQANDVLMRVSFDRRKALVLGSRQCRKDSE